MHIQDLQVDLTLHPDDWDGFEVVEDTLLDGDSEKGNTTNEIVVKRISDNKFFKVEYTQYRDEIEYEEDVTEVFPVTKTITVYE
jgi:hypothetical protein